MGFLYLFSFRLAAFVYPNTCRYHAATFLSIPAQVDEKQISQLRLIRDFGETKETTQKRRC
jgi:hypothetical protein